MNRVRKREAVAAVNSEIVLQVIEKEKEDLDLVLDLIPDQEIIDMESDK